MKKRGLSIILILVLLVCLTACGGTSGDTAEGDGGTETAEQGDL